jgi:predicted ATPase
VRIGPPHRPWPARRERHSPFVGREAELGSLRSAFDDAHAARSRIVLLSGEPGIGKTRTALEAVGEAQRGGMHVLRGHCREGEARPPLAPWVQVVRAYLGNGEPHDAAVVADLAPVVSEIRACLPDLRPPLEPSAARRRLFEAMGTLLANAASRRPLLLVLEDLHAADATSLRLLASLPSTLSGARVLVLGTYRDTELRRGHALATVLAELAQAPGTQRIRLGGLSDVEVRGLIERLVRGASAELSTAAVQRSEGNPLFVHELVRLVASAAGGDGRVLRVPESVRDLIGRRLDTLSPECNGLLGLAAVLGPRFDARTLAALAETPPARTRQVLEAAADAHVLVARPPPTGRYAFAHDLFRGVLYEEMETERRLAAHRRVAALAEHRAGPSAQRVLTLAHHLFAGARAGADLAKAIAYSRRAAALALSQLAYEDAALHYERALEMLELGAAADPERCKLLLDRGDALVRAGDVDAARASFLEAADIARRLPAQCGPADHAALRGRVLGRLS